MKRIFFPLITLALAAGCTQSAINISPDSNISGDNGTAGGSTGITIVETDPDDDIANTSFEGQITITFSKTGDATVEGDTYGYVTIDGNKVTVNNTGGEVLSYELTGATDNGFLKIYGAKKQAIVLHDVQIINPDGAAINNQNKKRTFVVLKGSNLLSDSASAAYAAEGEEDLKAVFFSEAQLIFSGDGALRVDALNAQGKSAIATDDYLILTDGPALEINAGSSAGHGLRGKDSVRLLGGKATIRTEAALKKGISSDEFVLVEGGEHAIMVTGGVAYDEEDGEYSGTAGVKADNFFAMTGGSLTIKNTGDGGKGINAGSYDYDAVNHSLADSYISGGTLSITTNGHEQSDVSAKGIKIGWVTKNGSGDHATVTGYAGNLLISGGSVTVSSAGGEGLEVKGDLSIEGGQTYVSSTADDAINCQGDLSVSGGYVYASSSQNDAMDSNGDTRLSGGFVMAVCTRGAPEVAIDANTEGGKRLYIDAGATLVAYGGLESGYSASQSVYSMSGSAGAWNALYGGNAFIAAFKAPAGLSTFVVSAPSLSSGYKDVSVSGEALCNGIWAADGISGGSSVALSTYSGGGGQGGPGGGQGGPGGGQGDPGGPGGQGGQGGQGGPGGRP